MQKSHCVNTFSGHRHALFLLDSRIPRVRGCSPWRPAADMGTIRRENQIYHPDLNGQMKRTGHHKNAMLCGNSIRISARSDSTDLVPIKEERTLTRALASVSGFVCVNAFGAEYRSPRPSSGKLTRFPFDRRRHNGI